MHNKYEILVNDLEEDKETSPSSDSEMRFLRLSADFDNYRKRTETERTEQTKRIRSEVLSSILPVYDDFLHLMAHSEGELSDGLRALQSTWQQWMQQNELEEIGEIGQEFDYTIHEAVLQEPVEDEEMDGRITRVIKKGYVHADQVLRHARVAVGRHEGPPASGHKNQQEVEINDL